MTAFAIKRQIRTLMEKRGYHPTHTGGGCWTWEKIGPASFDWICTDDNHLNGDPAAAVWVAGRYRDSPDHPGWINVTQLTLDQAVEHIERLPTPERGQGDVIDGLAALLRAYPTNY